MTPAQTSEHAIEVEAEHVGGIDRSAVTLHPGVNVLVGRNATNRTSFLQALMAGLGSSGASLKGDAEEGRVELTVDGERYTRTLTRRNGSVAFGGDPYLDDPTKADLFAFLLETNEARQAVARGDDLREVVMRPVDTASIQADIERLIAERREIDAELEDVEDAKARLPELEERRRSLEADVEAKREELAEIRAELEDSDSGVEAAREREDELDERLDALNDARSTLEDVRYQLETERESLDSVREEHSSLAEEREDLPETPEEAIEELERRQEELRRRKRECDSTVSTLQTVIQFNEEMLEGENGLIELLREEDGESAGAVTDRLLGDDAGVCWTCGTEVDADRIEATLDRLRDIAREKRAERANLTEQLEELKAEHDDLTTASERRATLEQREERLADEIGDREDAIERLKEERAEVQDRLEELQDAVSDLESEVDETVLERHEEATEVEFELGRLDSDLERVEERIREAESVVETEADLREERERIASDLEDLRTRVDRLERETVEQFNEHMEELLSVLDYGNLERVWLERRERQAREGRRTVTRSDFDLHIVRRTDEGTTYEDTVEHLSESEREVTGLVFALAGYLVHAVYETLPFMLLDSLEAIDSERIAALVEYFEAYAPTIVVALLPEDAQALSEGYTRITDI
ncbi:archaea-specific SMC-related protein [Halomarina litorea]|uniref:archaea-specific SMC-related protein n=1 Tax=Halomarina litorea TaxID=2961595 RepID=UPI0020C3B3C7|nr:archaea-specific SMC-related protein [Halomarina sp. BCD28]